MNEILINYNDQDQDVIVLENGIVTEKYKEQKNSKMLEGNVYVGRVDDIIVGMQVAFVDIGDEKKAFLHIKDIVPKVSNITGNKNEKMSNFNISKLVKKGMPVIVQVKKDKCDSKGARISTNLNIAGMYVAMAPNEGFVTVSNKIENDRVVVEHFKTIVRENANTKNGYILRTNGLGKNDEQIINDIKNIEKIYDTIKLEADKAIANNDFPKKIYDAGGIIDKILLGSIENVDKVNVNNKEIFENINMKYSEFKDKIKFSNDESLLDSDIMAQLEKFENRKIWLKCGGFITIDKTEALTAIDVNAGKFSGKNNMEESVLKVNEEATYELAKQLRARDIGGIIIVDYIDMEEKTSEEKIVKILENVLKKDRAKTQVIGFTPLHLLELTRKHICNK